MFALFLILSSLLIICINVLIISPRPCNDSCFFVHFVYVVAANSFSWFLPSPHPSVSSSALGLEDAGLCFFCLCSPSVPQAASSAVFCSIILISQLVSNSLEERPNVSA